MGAGKALGALALGILVCLLPVGIRYLTVMLVSMFWAVILGPLLVGAIGMAILFVMRQWVAAIGFFVLTGLVSVLALTYVYQPGLAVALGSALVTLTAVGYGIYLGIARQDFFAMIGLILLAVGVDVAGGYLLLQCSDGMSRFANIIATEWLPIGFSGLLIVAVSLLGVEWLTRKLLRLA